MKLYLLRANGVGGLDTYHGCVVAAKSNEEARKIHPSGDEMLWGGGRYGPTWARSPEDVTATCIGTARKGTRPGVILAAFHAG